MTKIALKKKQFPTSKGFKKYLVDHSRYVSLPISYDDLLNYHESLPHIDSNKKDTLWETLVYDHGTLEELEPALVQSYALLKTEGVTSVLDHLRLERVDFCTFGNTKPFRIRIVNRYNDNYDYFYVKKSDSSRLYGLELEHILSPNRINYLVHKSTMLEEHIFGIPGDVFNRDYLHTGNINRVRLAKEFVKFNERCFVRLLGDMRSYNYVVDITPDFDGEQYRIRAIDFDQQSHEGKKSVYLPQSYSDNEVVVEFVRDTMKPDSIRQYQYEERTLIARRLRSAHARIRKLLAQMEKDRLATKENVSQLGSELSVHYGLNDIKRFKTMGSLLRYHLQLLMIGQKSDPSLIDADGSNF